MKALLVVDLQNDFLPGGALAVQNGDLIIDQINQIQEQFDLIVATQDWHPKAHQSFASEHPEHKVFDEISLHGLNQVLWPDHCVQGTKGADFSSKWESNKVQAIFRKGMDPRVDSYSGFYDNGSKNPTALAGYLKDKQVQRLYICGLAADFCVYYSARDAVKLGFDTYFLAFATQAISEPGYEKALAHLQELGVTIIKTQQDLHG